MRIRWRGFELPTRVVLEEDDPKHLYGHYGRFIVEPFERGYGTTIGNSLRRALLSSIQGTAFTSIKIDGVAHEFGTIDGVQEDVVDIVLNIKQVLLKMFDDGPVDLVLEKTGEGPVTAGDIADTERAEIINKDLHLCTITSPDTTVRIELTAQSGRGYMTADENAARNGDATVGEIPIDSIFSPVRRVKYATENTRVGQVTNHDKLTLEIWTDGSITPENALVEA